MAETEHGYIALYQGQRAEITAATLYQARERAAAHFNLPSTKAYLVSLARKTEEKS